MGSEALRQSSIGVVTDNICADLTILLHASIQLSHLPDPNDVLTVEHTDSCCTSYLTTGIYDKLL